MANIVVKVRIPDTENAVHVLIDDALYTGRTLQLFGDRLLPAIGMTCSLRICTAEMVDSSQQLVLKEMPEAMIWLKESLIDGLHGIVPKLERIITEEVNSMPTNLLSKPPCLRFLALLYCGFKWDG